MLHKALDGEYRWMCYVWFAFRLVASVGNSSASMAVFNREEFVANPTLKQLDLCRKVDLCLVANYFSISVSNTLVKSEMKEAVVSGLVQKGVLSLVAGETSSDVQVEVTDKAEHADVVTPLFTLPRLLPLSVESSSSSRDDARLKVRLVRLQLDREERERDFQLRRELELKCLEAETALKMRGLELQARAAPSSVSPEIRSSSNTTFDVSKNIALVPAFRESEVEGYFSAFERIAVALHWPRDVWAILLQCKLTGKAQEACAALSVEDSLCFDQVKSAVLRVYELVPEAYRQRFRGLGKVVSQTYADFAREKVTLFDRWCAACKVEDFSSLRELMLLEEFKNCVPERIVVYLNEQKVVTLQQAAMLADEFALTHKGVFSKSISSSVSPPHLSASKKPSDRQVPRVGSTNSTSSAKTDRLCFFCHKAGHLIADCTTMKQKQQGLVTKQPKGVGLIKTVTSGSELTSTKEPDECFKPFILHGSVSLTGQVEDQQQVTILRDTGGSRSFILSSVLPLDAKSACDVSTVV